MIVPLYRFTPFGKQINYEVYKALEEMKIIITGTKPKTIKTITDIYNKKKGEFTNKDFEDIKRLLLEDDFYIKPMQIKQQLIPVYGGTLPPKTKKIKASNYTLKFGVEVECFIEITDKFIEKFLEYFNSNEEMETSNLITNINIFISTYEMTNDINQLKQDLKLLFEDYKRNEDYDDDADEIITLLSKILKMKKIEPRYTSYEITKKYEIKIKDFEDTEIKEDFAIMTDGSVECLEKICKLYHKIDDKPDNFTNIESKSVFEYIEFVSRIFESPTDVKNGLTNLNKKIDEFFGKELFNSNKTSNHIHFSLNKNGEIQTAKDPEFIMVFISLWYILEEFIFSLCAYFRKGEKFCKSISSHIKDLPLNIINGITEKYILQLCSTQYFDLTDRSHTLNITNLFETDVKSDKPTLEIRIKHGSNDPEETYQFCILIEKIVRKAEIILEELQSHKNKPIITFINEHYGITATEINPDRILSFLGCTRKEQDYWKSHIEKIQKFNKIYK